VETRDVAVIPIAHIFWTIPRASRSVSVAAVCKRRNRHVSALTESRYKPKVQKQADFGIKPVDKPKTDPLQKWQKIFFEGSSGLTSISAGGMTLTLGYPLVGGVDFMRACVYNSIYISRMQIYSAGVGHAADLG
jgi:hypothetical protein